MPVLQVEKEKTDSITFTIKPVRFIPFDLGARLSAKSVADITSHLASKGSIKELSRMQESILSERDVINCSIHPQYTNGFEVTLSIFHTGIGVITIKDPERTYQNDPLFVVDYLNHRKETHKALLNWTHPCSPLLNELLSKLRKIVRQYHKTIRPSANKNWENKGISYVMTIAFFQEIGTGNSDGIIKWEELPHSLQKAIPAILNPSTLLLEDSLILSHDRSLKDEEILSILDESFKKPADLDQRNHVLTFMSWAAVIILGNCNESEEEEYTFLEIEIQHHWYYLYCLDNDLPIADLKSKKSKLTLEQIMEQKFEAELLEENIKYIDDSSKPERLNPIIEGLIETSGILDVLRKYKRKLAFSEEMLKIRQQSVQKLLSQTSEILLFAVAYLQLAPKMYEIMVKKMTYQHEAVLSFTILLMLFVLGSIVLVLRNKYK